jgi:serine O-acetyltransferase
MDALKADTVRQFGRFNWWLVAKGFLASPTYRVLVTFRGCQAARQCPPVLRWATFVCARLLHGLACQWAGIELPWRTEIAPGLALTHGRGIVINAGTRIGSNVTLFHGVTLGQRDHIDNEGRRFTTYPVIEDEVWIGPQAIVVGGVTIGKGSRIAGGAYIFRSVPPYSVVLGNPGEIVKTNCTPDVDNRWEPFQDDINPAAPDSRTAEFRAADNSTAAKRRQPQRP